MQPNEVIGSCWLKQSIASLPQSSVLHDSRSTCSAMPRRMIASWRCSGGIRWSWPTFAMYIASITGRHLPVPICASTSPSSAPSTGWQRIAARWSLASARQVASASVRSLVLHSVSSSATLAVISASGAPGAISDAIDTAASWHFSLGARAGAGAAALPLLPPPPGSLLLHAASDAHARAGTSQREIVLDMRRTLPDPPARLQVLLDLALELAARHRADHLADDLAALEDQER